jgi:tetratricopeptide (TPR) repeat protein
MDGTIILGGVGMTYSDESEREITDEDVRILTVQHELQSVSAYYYYRGNAYETKRDCESMIDNCKKVIESNPNNIIAYINRGVAHIVNGDYDLAIVDWNKALQIDSNNPVARKNIELLGK